MQKVIKMNIWDDPGHLYTTAHVFPNEPMLGRLEKLYTFIKEKQDEIKSRLV